MTRVVAIILHALPDAGAGPLVSAFAAQRRANADAQALGFVAVGAESRVISVPGDRAAFGARLRALATDHPGSGLIILGSGSTPLATRADRAAFVAAADGQLDGSVLVNNRYSADILAIPAGVDLRGLPDLGADNAVPNWLSGQGIAVRDLRGRWRLQVDLDSPADVLLMQGRGTADRPPADPIAQRFTAAAMRVSAVAGDPAAELLIAGRTSADTLRWVERRTASRTRALIEERGMKTARPDQRPTRSTLGLHLDRTGPAGLGSLIEGLADAAIVDTRVLMAHHFGRDEAGWPVAEDRFASDLLLHERIQDPWLRELTESAEAASVPVLLGGHTLVGPGIRLLLRPDGR